MSKIKEQTNLCLVFQGLPVLFFKVPLAEKKIHITSPRRRGLADPRADCYKQKANCGACHRDPLWQVGVTEGLSFCSSPPLLLVVFFADRSLYGIVLGASRTELRIRSHVVYRLVTGRPRPLSSRDVSLMTQRSIFLTSKAKRVLGFQHYVLTSIIMPEWVLRGS